MRAELAREIQTSSWKPGDTFFLNTKTAWQGTSCTIPANTTITGEVVRMAAQPGGRHRSAVSLRFAAVPCAGEQDKAVLPLLVAMQEAPTPPDGALQRLATANIEHQQITNLFSNPAGAAAAGVKADTLTNSIGNAAQTLNSTVFGGTGPEPQLKTGEVHGIRGVSMVLPQTDPATTLVFAREISLERHTQFVLLFTSAAASAQQAAWSVASSPKHEASAARLPALPHEQAKNPEPEVCAPGGCKEAIATALPASAAAWKLPLLDQGWTPRLNRTITALDDEVSIHSLGDDQLLVTFPMHVLLHRTRKEMEQSARPRQVRALLLSTKDGRILQRRDWTVGDSTSPYVWSYGADALLLHEGDDLVAYGPGLTERERWHLPGPLVFVSASPGGELALAATMHEKHTEQEHRKLEAFLGPDWPIEEQYDLTGLDSHLRPIGSRRMNLEPLRPALLRSAMVSVGASRGDRFELDEDSWGGQRRRLASLASACDLDVLSLAHDLLFAQGCVAQKRESGWFRVIHADGATELQGRLAPFQLLQQVQTDTAGTLLAVATTQFDKRVDLSGSMHEGEFSRLEVAVYSVATGKTVFAARPEAGSALRDTFALAPSGKSLAILTEAGVQAYQLPPQTTEAAGTVAQRY